MRATRRSVLAGATAALAGCLGGPRASGDGAGSGDGTGSSGCSGDSPETGQARIGFVGDVMLGRSVNEHWSGEEPAGVWGDTLDRLQALDGLVCNLECCISARGTRWPDKTYYFRADPDFAVPALTAAGTSVASLANNHVLDFGEVALADTRRHLDEAGIAHAGAGPDRESALDPAITQAGGLTVATVALTDQYRAYASGGDSPGTAYTRLDRTDPRTRSLVDDALARAGDHDPDLVAATLHWGPNWRTVPDDTQRRFARWLVDRGVDVVHGHSAHVLQGVEIYRGRPILYDTGDYVDDYIDKDGFQNKRSALFEVVADGGPATLRVVPVEIDDETATIAGEEAAAWVRETLRERSRTFGTEFERAGAGLTASLGEC